jgi:hypothetical protein
VKRQGDKARSGLIALPHDFSASTHRPRIATVPTASNDHHRAASRPYALCLRCGKKLGGGSVSVIGQQHESKLAAHRAVPEVRDFLAATA